ncbi:MAG: UDP-N-acetyl-D-mannosamine dehydrogenase [Nitrospinae bacterium]|nr:UDP-N-acetyl-D-mannosamine dehydrogenase [Nitrospinota bacterium]
MNHPYNTVSVVGLGYIGLPTAAILASHGLNVIGVDVAPGVVDSLNNGKVHIVEPDLDSMVHMAVINKRLGATLKPSPADAFIIAVPTPITEGNRPDVSFVMSAARGIAPVLAKNNLIILESTSPVGTTEEMVAMLAKLRPDISFPGPGGKPADVRVAYCPERVLPGRILKELVENDRIIGGITPACAAEAQKLYGVFVRGECIVTDARTAEMTKLTENAFRDVNIAFANELSLICEKVGIDVWELISLANRHPRVNILQPGPGVGGHCIAVDPWFIVHSAPEQARLLRTAREVNDAKPEFVISQVRKKTRKFNNPVVACLGLAFKADIDDLRESPALHITEKLAEESKWSLLVVEPYISELPIGLKGKANVAHSSLDEALQKADVVLMLVNHKQFANISPESLKGKELVDTRGVWRAHRRVS